MGPRSGNRWGRIAGIAAFETEFGFVQKSRQIKNLGRIQAQN
jgi:hypothetical protein